MYLRKTALARVYGPPDDGAGGGAGDGKPTITPEVQALIDAAVAETTTGLKTKNTELLGKLREQGDKLKTFDGIDPVAVRNILKRFSDDEEAALIAKGEIDKVLERRTERMREEMGRKLTEAETKALAAETRSKAYEGRVLDDAVRAALAKAGLHPHAVDDALLHARIMFSLDDKGNAVALGEDGKPVLGKDGKTAFSPTEWIEGMREKKPHWFPASASGGGAGGSGGGPRAVNKPASQMSTAEKAAYIKDNGLEAWGTKVSADYHAKPATATQ
jgi:hypothetical protein